MPRRRRHATLTKQDIRIALYLIIISPIIIVICIVIYYIFSFANWLNTNLGIPNRLTLNFAVFASIALIVGIPIAFAVYNRYQNEQARKFKDEWEKKYKDEQEKKYKGIQIANIDSMAGIEFEQYLQKLLTNQGYSVHVTQASGDLGVDLVALRNGDKIAIQAKRHNTKVSRRAISDAVAGIHHYGCNKAMVVTNNYFSPGAVTLAQSTGCILIDRDTLAEWVIEFQNTSA